VFFLNNLFLGPAFWKRLSPLLS